MTIVLNEKLSAEEIEALLKKIEPAPKFFDAKKYFNKVAIEVDPLKIQQQMRDESSKYLSFRYKYSNVFN